MCLPLGVVVENVKEIQSNKYEYLRKQNDVFKGYIKIRETDKKLDFSVNCEKCRKKVNTRATPGRSLVKI